MEIRKHLLLSLAALAFNMGSAWAQTVNVPFSTSAQGKSLPIEWGMDTAWDDLYNVNWGIAHYGTNFTTGRISFQPYELVDASKIDDPSANFGLPLKMARKLQQRIDHIKLTGTTKVAINNDHEVLTRKLDENGNYGNEEDNVGKKNYVPTSGTADATYTSRWMNLIKACVKYAQAQGLEVVSVAPFNESDFGWNQYYCDKYGYNETNQQKYGMPDFLAIARAIKADPFFATGAGKDVRICGPNTLNCDRALPWYNYSGMADVIDEGNTHQLAGSFDNYANFFKTIRDAGKVATADELHNVGEAMVGVQYGMQNGIWWAFDAKARGQFMHDSNEGVRLGYAEDRSHWTSAAVYRNDKDGEIHGFIGSSERQANVSTYNFQCQDREVYFNGYGPQKEWSVTTVGGAAGSYQEGQINYEYLFDITYGEDVQSAPIDGYYQIMSAADMKLVTGNAYGNDISANSQGNSSLQCWHIYPDNVKAKGDCSYWFIDLQSDVNQHLNLRSGNLNAGTKVLTYNADHDALEQWYFRYAKDGYFYIITRQSNKYLYNNNGVISVEEGPTAATSASKLKKYMWRLMPTDAAAETTAPAAPRGLAEGTVNATSVSFSWTAVTGELKAVTYNILRQDANGWNTIARCQAGTTYTDNNVEAGKAYNFKVQAVDYSGNRSEMSDIITIIVPGSENSSSYTAGTWQWTGETSAAGSWYLYNVGKANFLAMQSDHKPYVNTSIASATLFTTTNANSSSFKYQDGKDYYLYHSAGTVSESTTALTWTISSYNTGYQLKTSAREGWSISTTTRGLVGNNAGSTCSVSKTASDYNSTNGTWLFISPSQMTKYGKMSAYTAAFNGAAGYLSQNISSELRTRLESTLDACDGTINKDTDIDNYISQLDAIATECQTYLENNTGSGPSDLTSLIVNPTIRQNGTTNDAPNGWKGATTNVTGNGHWTEGTGDTRLEAWNWATNPNGLNVDYYQDIILPNGLYTLTAVTHQRANGDAALYGETYKSFETTMPVGDGNEAETQVTSILVTDGSLRIGMKATNDYKDADNQWATADDFTLTRVSDQENTALSHYQAAVTYLDGLAAVELARNIDLTELNAAKAATQNCTTQAEYAKAINAYKAAIEHARLMEELQIPEEGADVSGLLPSSWIGQTGTYWNSSAPERYQGDNAAIPEGRALYQVVEDLIPGGKYEIQFYAVANVARVLGAEYYGNGIAYLFANDTEEDIEVIFQSGCTPTDYLRTLTAVADENGEIAYGIANRKAGGQWYVAKAKSMTFVEYVGLTPSDPVDPEQPKVRWMEMAEMPANLSDYYFAFVDANGELALSFEEGLNQTTEAGYKTMVYRTSPETWEMTPAMLWTLESNANGGLSIKSATDGSKYLQTENGNAQYCRTHDNGGGNASWYNWVFAYGNNTWTIQNGKYPESGYLGVWANNGVPTNGVNVAANCINESGTDRVKGRFKIYAAYRNEVDWEEQATEENPANYSYKIKNANAGFGGTTGWTGTGANTRNGSNGYDGVAGFFEFCNWSASSWEGSLSQTITGLPNGRYQVRAAGQLSASDVVMSLKAGNNSANFEANGTSNGNILQTGVETENGSGVAGWRYAVIDDVLVLNGELTIGATSSATAVNRWANVDNFELFYLGAVTTGMDDIIDGVHYYVGTFDEAVNVELSNEVPVADFTGATVSGTIRVTTSNANSVFYVKSGQTVTGMTNNLVVDGTCANLVLSDGGTFKAHKNFEATHATYTMTAIADNGTKRFGTLMLPYAVSSLAGEAYALDQSVGIGEEIHATQVNAINANTPVLVTAAGEYAADGVSVAATNDTYENGELRGTYKVMTAEEGTYVLQKHASRVAFFLVGNDAATPTKPTVNPFRAYIKAQGTNGVKALNVVFDDEDAMDRVAETEEGTVVYDLSGRKVSANANLKGIYIVNGKKVIRK